MVEPILFETKPESVIFDGPEAESGQIMVRFESAAQLHEIRARLQAKRFTDGETWSITRPSEFGRRLGHPEFRVMVIGECWHDIERRIAHARIMGNFTKPHDPDVQRLVNAMRAVPIPDRREPMPKFYDRMDAWLRDTYRPAIKPFEKEDDHG